ncbi:MAG: PPOX class probable FMN-dependent enzyme [Cellvibrionaceae bacterium]|jgi:PPOX class probable FMN-dependent enzyme
MNENQFRTKFGEPSKRAAEKILPHMTDWVQAFIQNSPFAVLSTADNDGNCDASPRGGKPGFVKVLDEKTLLIPDIRGNRLFDSYTNISKNPKAGLVFMIPGFNYTARINGRVRFVEKEELDQMGIEGEVFDPDEEAITLQALLLEVDVAYGHCPRSLSFGRVWDTEQIEHNRANPPKAIFG